MEELDLTVPTIKYPIVYLERCDKIWETLQLIKTVQNKDPVAVNDDNSTEKKEKVPQQNTTEQSSVRIRRQATLKGASAMAQLPFKFSVQRTKKVFPCITCGKQYLENRSLRNHSLKVHGIIIPCRFRRRNRSTRDSSVTSSTKENYSSEELIGDKNKKATTLESETTNFSTVRSLRSRNTIHDTSSTNVQSREKTEVKSTSPLKLSRCALCRQKVMSVRKHLIRYHKIGCSSSMIRELESTLAIDTETSKDNETTPKGTLSNKLSQKSVNRDRQDRVGTNNNEDKCQKMPQVRQKRKYVKTKQKYKMNIERYMSVQSKFTHTQRTKSLNVISYKCDICLGKYASANSYTKHRRIHRLRGETKENFHNFTCRYFNSPLSKKLPESSTKSTDTVANDDSEYVQTCSRTSGYNGKLNKNNTTCSCGRKFRNPYTLFVHKKSCNLSPQRDEMTQRVTRDKNSSDRDSGIGINITIKKRNNSYEIVGKDDDEGKEVENPDLNDGILSSNVHMSDAIKDPIDTYTEHEQSGAAESFASNENCVVKVKVETDETIIKIENDVQVIPEKNNEIKQMIKKSDANYLTERRNSDVENMKEGRTADQVCTSKQVSRETLNKPSPFEKTENTIIPEEGKINLRSSNKIYQNVKKDHDYTCKSKDVYMKDFDPFAKCAYCNEEFDSISMYDDHDCSVKEGKLFDKFSLNLLCFCCKDVLRTCSEFDEHMRTKHLDRRSYCYLCPNRFATDKERNRHSRAEHDTSCRFCRKKLAISVKSLHEAYHLGFGYPCHECKKAYSLKKHLLYHNSTIHKKEREDTVVCSICLKPVKLKTFRRHMYAHNHNECHFCGKTFTDRTGMEYHTLVYHSKHLKLRCSACNMLFLSEKQLQNHRDINGCNGSKKTKTEEVEKNNAVDSISRKVESTDVGSDSK